MSAPTSGTTVPAVKAALVALFRTSLTEITVIYGPRSSEPLTLANVMAVGARVTGQGDLDSMTVDTAHERYRVQLEISCTVDKPGDEGQQEAAELAWAYYNDAERLVREHPTQDLGVAGVLGALPSGSFEQIDSALKSGRNTWISFGVNVIAQRT